MVLWIGMLSGANVLPTSFDPISWHAHEFLFGYLSAIVAGFLLTAVPNWTGRRSIGALPLAGMFGLWLAGRAAMAVSANLSPIWVATIDLAMPIMLATTIAKEILKGRSWRNLAVLAMLLLLIIGNGIFHWEAAKGVHAAEGLGLRIGLAAAIMMVTIIGGRIVPAFTRSWLAQRAEGSLPAPFGLCDMAALLVISIALTLWVITPENRWTGLSLISAGLIHVVRLSRWQGYRTIAEPLVWVLHLGYAFVPIGALALGLAVIGGTPWPSNAAQHLWMAGAIGLMTLAVMTRATLGHTGYALHAGPGTAGVYLLLLMAAAIRLGAGLLPDLSYELTLLSGVCWILAFSIFIILYGLPLVAAGKTS